MVAIGWGDKDVDQVRFAGVGSLFPPPPPRGSIGGSKSRQLSSYYRSPSLPVTIAQPLLQLTCKGATFQWVEAATQAFEELKQKLTTLPVLAYPTFDRDFVLETDAFITGLGAVLPHCKEMGDCIQWPMLVSPSIHRRETTVRLNLKR